MDVNRAADNGNTPLHVAAGFGDDKMVKLLVTARGVDVNVQNTSADGATPLHLAVLHGKSSYRLTTYLENETNTRSVASFPGQLL